MSRTTTAGAATQTNKATQTTQPTSTQACLPQEKVAMRAYQKWVQRGCTHGNDQKDWTEAEAEVRAEMAKTGNTSATQARR
jgi:hypothetical protein